MKLSHIVEARDTPLNPLAALFDTLPPDDVIKDALKITDLPSDVQELHFCAEHWGLSKLNQISAIPLYLCDDIYDGLMDEIMNNFKEAEQVRVDGDLELALGKFFGIDTAYTEEHLIIHTRDLKKIQQSKFKASFNLLEHIEYILGDVAITDKEEFLTLVLKQYREQHFFMARLLAWYAKDSGVNYPEFRAIEKSLK